MVLNLNYRRLETLTYRSARLAFLEAQKRSSNENIYTFAIYTSDLYRYFLPYYNTEEALKKTGEFYINKYPSRYNDVEEIIKQIRWNCADWEYQEDYENFFDEINQILRNVPEQLNKLDEIEFNFTCQVLNDIIITVLSELNSTGIFGTNNQRNSIVITIAEDDPDKSSQLEIVKKLNPPEVYKRFKKELEFLWN